MNTNTETNTKTADPLLAADWDAPCVHIIQHDDVDIYIDARGRFVTLDDGNGVIQTQSHWSIGEAREYVTARKTACARVKKRVVNLPCVVAETGRPVTFMGYNKRSGELVVRDGADRLNLTSNATLYVDTPATRKALAEVVRLRRLIRDELIKIQTAAVKDTHVWKATLSTPDGYEKALCQFEAAHKKATDARSWERAIKGGE